MKYCAGIVTFNPKIERLKENIDAIISNLPVLIIVDNNSNNYIEISELAKNYDNILTIKNDINEGIAKALNQIVSESISLKFDWTLLLDQDSICDNNIFNHYSKALLDEQDDVGLLTPYIIDTNKMTIEEYRRLTLPKCSKVKFAITSASFINNNVFEKVKGYDEFLFIDCVDLDYSKKLEINNYKQIRVNDTYLLQEVGSAERTHIYRLHKDNAGKLSLQPYYRTNHSLFRQYYMARNNIIIIRKYKHYNNQISSYIFAFVYLFAKLIVEKNKVKLLKAQIRGIRDGIKADVDVYCC